VQLRRDSVELAAITALGWLALVSIPLALGGIGLGWDALNHHIYLGWVAEQPRFDRDFAAAGYQAYQFPYLYWPAYRLFEAGVSGRVAGAVLVSMHVLAVPALWLIARSCVPGGGWYETTMRGAAVALALSGEVFLSLMDTTANDGLAAVPLVWAVALAVLGTLPPSQGKPASKSCVVISGLMAGLATAFKLSNGPLALMLPLVWVMCGSDLRTRAMQVIRGSASTLLGFALAWSWWGWQLWTHFRNPFYPFLGNWFPGLATVGSP
jgi:hypothetical protein